MRELRGTATSRDTIRRAPFTTENSKVLLKDIGDPIDGVQKFVFRGDVRSRLPRIQEATLFQNNQASGVEQHTTSEAGLQAPENSA